MLFDLENPSRAVTIPKSLKRRIETLAREDEDLLANERAESENACLLHHYRRVWQKLSSKERALLLKQNVDCSEFDFFRRFRQILQSAKHVKNH